MEKKSRVSIKTDKARREKKGQLHSIMISMDASKLELRFRSER